MKVRKTQEWERPDLPQQLKTYAERSGKSVSQICKEAGISTAFWYQMMKGQKDSITYDTLAQICTAVGCTLQDVEVGIEEDS